MRHQLVESQGPRRATSGTTTICDVMTGRVGADIIRVAPDRRLAHREARRQRIPTRWRSFAKWLTDRRRSGEDYYEQRQVPAAVREDVESLLRFDRPSSDSAEGTHRRSRGRCSARERRGPSGTRRAQSGTGRSRTAAVGGRAPSGLSTSVSGIESNRSQLRSRCSTSGKPDLLFRFKREFRALIDVAGTPSGAPV